VATLRISKPAGDDLETILATSLERWGEQGRDRYAALLTAALKALARAPLAPTTRERPELAPDVRSFHIRHLRGRKGVHAPVHVIYYVATDSGIDVLRVLHERMEPTQHVGGTKSR
jgi:toxin ParE1/3/4